MSGTVDEALLADLRRQVAERQRCLREAEELARSFPTETDYGIGAAGRRNELHAAERRLDEARLEFERQKRERADAANQQMISAMRDTAEATWAAARAAKWAAVFTAIGTAVTAAVAVWSARR